MSDSKRLTKTKTTKAKTQTPMAVPELPANAAELLKGKIPDEVLEMALSKTDELRAYGLVTLEGLLRPKAEIPKNYVFMPRERQAVADIAFMAFDLLGGVSSFASWGQQNPTEFYKLFMRLMPEAEKAAPVAPTIQIINAVPSSPLDQGFYDLDAENDEDTGGIDE